MKSKRKHFVTCGQMKLLEKRADEAGLSYYQMMENAGRGAAAQIMERAAYRRIIGFGGAGGMDMDIPKIAEAVTVDISNDSPNGDANVRPDAIRAMIFCGKGNNGGDGFVAARILSDAGYDVTVVLVDGEPKTEDAIANFDLLSQMPVRIMDMTKNESSLMELKGAPDIIVDAIYGTGFHGSLSGNALKAAIYINRFSKGQQTDGTRVFALDIPSGLGGDLTDEKELERSSVTAHYTITFHARKPVHLQKFAEKYCGKIIVVDIGIDEEKLWDVEY